MNTKEKKSESVKTAPSLKFMGIEWGSYQEKEAVAKICLAIFSLGIAIILAIFISPWLLVLAIPLLLIGAIVIPLY